MTEQEMIDGYMDGLDLSSPEPSANRSRSYHHGFENGRADRAGKPAAPTVELRRKQAEEAIAEDAKDWMFG